MLAEIAVYLSSLPQTPNSFRPYLAGAVGLWARGRRQARAWAPHQQATKAVIGRAMQRISERRTVAVLGSGPLFDVPLEALAAQFERVLLIDLAHLSACAQRVAKHRNVERVWRDLAPEGETETLGFLADVPDLDWVISVNLLSQIARDAPEDTARDVVDVHLRGLTALPAAVSMVTDVAYSVFDRQGREVEAADMLHGRKLPHPARQWEWEVAPFGEESPSTRRVHTVFAFADWHAASGLGS